MKFLFFLIKTLFLLGLFCASCSGWNKIDSTKLIKEWKVDYIDLNGKKVKHLHFGDEEFIYDFRNDKTYLIYLPSNKAEFSATGKWKVNEDETIDLKDAKNVTYAKIVSVEDNNMILTPVSNDSNQYGNLVRYHYIPK
ncbi:hypothetical protein ASG01_08545 [Chryseobacterium sp. Leaf180]|uniref:hypothetical protein n=1 Tax=Chryseobacterium sp. Leaf180 TaxID=1736289 RepID=UPI0006FD1A8E|nr:hypothetical protein [Chryseobacterium sp. Leaf180]KQR93898.1 hypothetical protein ASG01_08545 [Chryseobacterium sp. Leaf180]